MIKRFEQFTEDPTIKEVEVLIDTTDGSCEGIIDEEALSYYEEYIDDNNENKKIIRKYFGWKLKNPIYHGSQPHDYSFVPFTLDLVSPEGKIFKCSGIGCPAEIQLQNIKRQ